MTIAPSTGSGWAALAERVDPVVQQLIEANRLPGITVAITRNGRLLLTKGYGYARLDGTKKTKMTQSSRSKIGSNSKPCVTGAAATKLLLAKGVNPATTLLYGPTGLFGGDYDTDIFQGTQALSSIPQRSWYSKITVQHLFDHHAGFAESADIDGAAKFFGIPDDEVTYHHLHRHFLLKKRLVAEPGTYSYSSFGFGLFTLVIERLSGQPFRDYVRDEFLAPLGLESRVRPERAHPDSCDAWQHDRNDDGTFDLMSFGDSGPALAQGGFMAAAEDLARIMAHLADTYSSAELDAAGWFRTDKGKLYHNGKLTGGASFAELFPEGYIAASGADLGGINVAVATNVRTSTDDLAACANMLALAVPESAVPGSFDLWAQRPKPACEYARWGVAASDYQRLYDGAKADGYRLEWIDGYWDGDTVRFNVIFRVSDTPRGPTHHNMTGDDYQRRYDEYKAKGFSLAHVDSYPVGSGVRYAAIWADTGTAVRAYHATTQSDHQEKFDAWTDEGWRPKVISVTSVSGERRYTALYRKESTGSLFADSTMTSADYQSTYDENKRNGRHLVYLKSYVHDGTPMFSAIWAEKPAISSIRAGHELTSDLLSSRRQDALDAGLATRGITASGGPGGRFAAFWTL